MAKITGRDAIEHKMQLAHTMLNVLLDHQPGAVWAVSHHTDIRQMSLMSIPPFPRPYENCDPQEKLRRLRESYAHNRITLPELERRTTEALIEERDYEEKYG